MKGYISFLSKPFFPLQVTQGTKISLPIKLTLNFLKKENSLFLKNSSGVFELNVAECLA